RLGKRSTRRCRLLRTERLPHYDPASSREGPQRTRFAHELLSTTCVSNIAALLLRAAFVRRAVHRHWLWRPRGRSPPLTALVPDLHERLPAGCPSRLDAIPAVVESWRRGEV